MKQKRKAKKLQEKIWYRFAIGRVQQIGICYAALSVSVQDHSWSKETGKSLIESM